MHRLPWYETRSFTRLCTSKVAPKVPLSCSIRWVARWKKIPSSPFSICHQTVGRSGGLFELVYTIPSHGPVSQVTNCQNHKRRLYTRTRSNMHMECDICLACRRRYLAALSRYSYGLASLASFSETIISTAAMASCISLGCTMKEREVASENSLFNSVQNYSRPAVPLFPNISQRYRLYHYTTLHNAHHTTDC